MKKLKIAAAALCVCFLFTAAYAANAGGQGDPLITLSYLNGPFTQQVKDLVVFVLQRRRIGLVVTLALVTYWATYLVAAPAADFRYSFPLLLSIPLVLSLLLIPFGTPSSEDTERV